MVMCFCVALVPVFLAFLSFMGVTGFLEQLVVVKGIGTGKSGFRVFVGGLCEKNIS